MDNLAFKRNEADELYDLDDLQVGQRFTSGRLSISADQIKTFAAEFDPQPFHLDEEAALHTPFAGLAASGWHTAALTMRLNAGGGLPIAGGIVGRRGEIEWPRPVRPGDVLHVDGQVIAIEPSKSHPERGRVVVRSETKNQRGEVVQIATMTLVVPRRKES